MDTDIKCPDTNDNIIGFANDLRSGFQPDLSKTINLNDQSLETLNQQEITITTTTKLSTIKILKFPISKLEGLKQNTANIKFYFCEAQKLKTNIYTALKNYEQEKVDVVYVKSSINCGIQSCSVGLFFDKYLDNNIPPDQRAKQISKLNSIELSFYVVLVPDDANKGIYFEGLDKLTFPLVPCPYVNWVATAFYTQYIVKDYILNNGQIPGDQKYLLNIFTPAFGITNKPHDQKHFVCGTLKQMGQKDVEIGFKINAKKMEDSNLKKGKLTLNGGKIKCGDIELNMENTYGYVDSQYNIKSEQSRVDYFGKKTKFYYKQLIFVYDSNVKNVVEEKNYLYIIRDETEFKKYEPMCYGSADDLKQNFEFTLEIDKKEILDVKLMKDDKKNNVPVVYLKNDHIKKGKIDVECRGIKSGGRDERYDDYFKLAFKTKLQRVFKPELKVNNEPALSELIISSESDQVFGEYSCQLDCNDCSRKDLVPDRNLFLLPSTVFKVTNNIKVYSDSKDYMACDIVSNNVGNLKFMYVQYKGKNRIVYDAVRNVPEDKFKKNGNQVVYVGNEYKLTDQSFVECNYSAFDRPYMYQKKVIQYNDLRDQIDKVGNNILVPIIIVVGIVIFAIIGIIVLVTFRIIRRRKKIQLLSMASSASGASSMSNSKFSKSSVSGPISRSMSKSRTNKSNKSKTTSGRRTSKTQSKTTKSINKKNTTKSKTGSFAG